jgi:hypothetical protein
MYCYTCLAELSEIRNKFTDDFSKLQKNVADLQSSRNMKDLSVNGSVILK